MKKAICSVKVVSVTYRQKMKSFRDESVLVFAHLYFFLRFIHEASPQVKSPFWTFFKFHYIDIYKGIGIEWIKKSGLILS